jgi:Pvc16 N-terminal domain
VLNDVDQSLRSLIQSAVPTNGGPPLVAFQPPTPDWAAELTDPTINLFLYDVREDTDGQTSDDADVRDGGGRVVGRQPPMRKYQLSYLVSAWTKDPEEEHAILGAILASVPDEPAIPIEHLRGRLIDQGLPVRIKVGVPLTGANTWDLWSALGTPPRTAIEVVVTAPLVPEIRTDLAPPAEKLELGVKKEPPGAIGPEGELLPPAAEPAAAPKPKRKKTDGETPELEARPGKRWTTFKVREQAVPAPPGD